VETFTAAGAPAPVNAAVSDVAWVGSGNTVNLGTTANPWGGLGTAAVPTAVGDTATLIVIGDTTGATSGNSPAMTVVNGFVPHLAGAPALTSELTLEFAPTGGAGPAITLASAPPAWFWAGSAAAGAGGGAAGAAFAQVNMAGATSLANALDIAAGAAVQIDALGAATHSSVANGVVNLGAAGAGFAKVGLLDWFQFGGNTYIEEVINSGAAPAAHGALATGDIVIQLTGLVNVATDTHLHFI